MKSAFTLFGLSLAVYLGNSVVAQNLIVNGSFESSALAEGNYLLAPDALAPWQTTGTHVEIWVETAPPSADGGAAHGTHHMEINASDGNSTVFQTLVTVPARDYQLTFYHSPRPTVDSTLDVSVNSEILVSFAETGSGLTNFHWQKYTANFTATSNFTTIGFTDHQPGAAGTHIDNVSVVQFTYQFTVEKLWDFSGEYHDITDGGQGDRTVRLLHAPAGLVSGTYSEAFTNSTVGFSGTGTINGRVLTTPTGIIMRNKLILIANGRYLDDGASLHYEANVRGDYHFRDNSFIASLTGRVCFTRYGRTDCRTGTVPESFTVQPDMDGSWQLALNISGDPRLSGNATATLSNGKTVSFSCTGAKNRTGTSHVRLTGIGDSVGARLLVTLDTAGNLRKMTGRVFGQKVLVLR
jgi:hypothetical protein